LEKPNSTADLQANAIVGFSFGKPTKKVNLMGKKVFFERIRRLCPLTFHSPTSQWATATEYTLAWVISFGKGSYDLPSVVNLY